MSCGTTSGLVRLAAHAAVVVSATLTCLLLTGCEPYERDVGGRAFFSGLEGAEVPDFASGRPDGYLDPRGLAEANVREELEDGTVVLRARSALHLMKHVFETLRNDERDVFLEQVLSNATRQEFASHGTELQEGYDFLRRNLDEIDRLFARMPMGEYSPNAVYQPMGKGVHRLRLVSGAGRDLKWQGIDMIMEGGQQRLLWFYDASR